MGTFFDQMTGPATPIGQITNTCPYPQRAEPWRLGIWNRVCRERPPDPAPYPLYDAIAWLKSTAWLQAPTDQRSKLSGRIIHRTDSVRATVPVTCCRRSSVRFGTSPRHMRGPAHTVLAGVSPTLAVCAPLQTLESDMQVLYTTTDPAGRSRACGHLEGPPI